MNFAILLLHYTKWVEHTHVSSTIRAAVGPKLPFLLM